MSPIIRQKNGVLTNRSCCCPETNTSFYNGWKENQPDVACMTITATVNVDANGDWFHFDNPENDCEPSNRSVSFSSTQSLSCVAIKVTKKLYQQYGFMDLQIGGTIFVFDTTNPFVDLGFYGRGLIGILFDGSSDIWSDIPGIYMAFSPCYYTANFVVGTDTLTLPRFNAASCFETRCEYMQYLHNNGYIVTPNDLDGCGYDYYEDICCGICTKCGLLGGVFYPISPNIYASWCNFNGNPSVIEITKGGGGSCSGKAPECCYSNDTPQVVDLNYSASYSTDISYSFTEATLPECFDLLPADYSCAFGNNGYMHIDDLNTVFGCS